MAHIQANINKFYSKLQEFWSIERYADVTIQCGDRNFRCHRLALATTCEYFDAMFGGNFKEKSLEVISLPEIDAVAFEQVSKFIYTGDANVNSDNVLNLLQASELLNLPGIEDLCIQFLKVNKLTAGNVFDVFAFACSTKKNILIDICVRHIVRWFEILSSDESFYEIPYDSLKIILNQFSELHRRNENTLLNVITQWIQYDRDNRFQYVYELMRMVNFKDVSCTKIQFVYHEFLACANINLSTHTVEFLGHHQETSKIQQYASMLKEDKNLHFFVKHFGETSWRILSVNSSYSCSSSGEISQVHVSEWIRCVAVDDLYVYGINYLYKAPGMLHKQKFCVYSSIDMRSEIELKPPPLIMYGKRAAVCAVQNNIYVYHPYAPHIDENCRTSSSITFSDEEIRSGIFLYNCETDNWFPVPVIKKSLENSCLTVCNDTLYVVGGGIFPFSFDCIGYAQTYDYREGKWQELPRSNHSYSAAACCTIEGKVYVCGGLLRPSTQLERYDPTAGKWENLAPMNRFMFYHEAVAYKKQLWVMGSVNLQLTKVEEDLVVRIYDPNTNAWTNFTALLEKNVQPACIMDAIVFRSL